MATCMSSLDINIFDEHHYNGGCLVRTYYFTHILPGKSVRLPPDPQATIYDWLFLKKVARKTKKTKHVKTEVPYNYEDCKPKREWSNNEDEYDSDDCSSHGILLKALQRKAEWGIHLKELRATIETFRIGIKNRVSEMRKRPKRRHRIDKKKGIALQRVFNRNCCEEMLKWLTETSDEMSNQQANC
ncbi:uncharacterized protein [Onthophagus taurus]|uniref:uncharacterized protein n=1 Tax=Onthophagus taurus TaxID=166361 RepID=UPI000C1FFE07|nr:uncharacterized protein LOC111425636 [Onthophagus taurus]